MHRNTWWGKTLRFIGIVLMALTSGFILLGGIGTICAALFPDNWESMAPLASYQWLYILFVLSGIAIGVWGIAATVKLVRGTSDAYKMSLLVLATSLAVGAFHIYMSRMLRGKSMPVDAVVYMTVLTLIIFLLFRIPFIWDGVNFEKGDSRSNRTAGGAAAILLGLMTLTIQYSMGPTHTWNGTNYADAFNLLMTSVGLSLLCLGGWMLARKRILKGRSSSLLLQDKTI